MSLSVQGVADGVCRKAQGQSARTGYFYDLVPALGAVSTGSVYFLKVYSVGITGLYGNFENNT